MRVTQEKTLDGHTYSVTQLPAMAAYRLLVRLAQIAAPAAGMAGSGNLGDLDFGVVAGVLPKMLEQLSEQELERITRLLLDSCVVDGSPLLPKFDSHFQGRVWVIPQLVWFALTVNYGNFPAALVALGQGRATGAKSPSDTSNISAGPASG